MHTHHHLAVAACCALTLTGGVAGAQEGAAVLPYERAAMARWDARESAPVWSGERRGLPRQFTDFSAMTPTPRPLARPEAFDQVPEELLLKLPDLPAAPARVVEEEVDFSVLGGQRIAFGPAAAGPVDGDQARDLIRVVGYAQVRAGADKAALDDAAALAYATCVAAEHARAEGFGWMRRVSRVTRRARGGRVAEQIFTLTRAAPEGQALSVRAVQAACAKVGIPAAKSETGNKG